MRWSFLMVSFMFSATILLAIAAATPGQEPISPLGNAAQRAFYLGFDRNVFPGDDALPILRRTFSFSGFWLNNPPGAASNSWQGKRAALLHNGFGFLLLFNGRLDRDLRGASDPAAIGASDAQAAVASAQREGFQPGAVIFLDQEEGARLLPRQLAYVLAWVDAVNAAGYRAGAYCSGMPSKEGEGQSIITADDIRDHAGGRAIVFFVYNDACPPAPGCANPHNPPSPAASGVAFASVWQFAQSPRRREFTKTCKATYQSDGNCYAPSPNAPASIDVDLDSAASPDPSNGRQ
jgi:Domain of unknown function (DUF1906)